MKKSIVNFGKHAAALAVTSSALALPLMTLAVDPGLSALGDTGLQSASLMRIIGALIGTILVLLGIILVVLILYAGFIWMTAQGDATKTKKAKEMIYQAIIGLFIVFAAYAITNFVFDALTSVTEGKTFSANQ